MKVRAPVDSRRPTIFDGMVAIAAVAVAAASIRAATRAREVVEGDTVGFIVMTWDGGFSVFKEAAEQAVLAATLAWIAIRLRRPRPDHRRLRRQPGWSACSTAAVFAAVGLIPGAAILAARRFAGWEYFFYGGSDMASLAGIAVLATWINQRRLGACRPEPHWIDRSGRALGVAWVALMVLSFGEVIYFQLAMPIGPTAFAAPPIPVTPGPIVPPPAPAPLPEAAGDLPKSEP